MIAVLDFGSQYTHLITRRIRELGVYGEIFKHNVSSQTLKRKNIEGIILSGGPNSVYEKNAPKINEEIFNLTVPILGICYGHQLLANVLGGEVKAGNVREYGEENIAIKKSNRLFDGLEKKERVWFSHGDIVVKLSKEFEVLATTKLGIAAFCDGKLKIFGVQFHPEVHHTPKGNKILKNFLFKICEAQKAWSIGDLKLQLLSQLKGKISNKKVIIGVSGGVDSLVAATLLHKTIGDKLYCIFIDTGFLRKNEVEEVEKVFKKLKLKHFNVIDAKNQFLEALGGVTDPEEKRKRFSRVYFQIFDKTAKELGKDKKIEFLAQGTIYPDRVEAGKTSSFASVIKSHHNVQLPNKFSFQVVEPLADLYKDEVRKLGRSLGIPKEILTRHPFPGPGLAIRILGEITQERLEILREADAIFIEELKKSGYYKKIWQAFAALIPVKSVGVMGDVRTYEYIVTLRAVTSKDAMTADWARFPRPLLKRVSRRIINEVRGVNRVLYDISQKPPATIEYE